MNPMESTWVDALVASQFAGAETEIRVLEVDIERGDPAALERALTYLEADPYYFRSGYARQRIGRKLARQQLTEPQKARARTIALGWVSGSVHCGRVAAGSLAHAAANNSLRRALRAFLHDNNIEVARRALQTLLRVKHPGYDERDLRRMRDIVLSDAGRFPWLSPVDYHAAARLWSPEWNAELVALTQVHGPDRKAAKLLVESATRRARKRAGS
jgi:hypothetical protein